MARMEGVRQYQIVHRADGLHVRVVPRAGDVRETVRAAMVDALEAGGATGVPVHVEVVDTIERDATGVGKLKLVRSEVDRPVAAPAVR
jgi:hypothetical protein